MTLQSPKALLLSPHLDPKQVEALLSPYGFTDIQKADANLQVIGDEPRTRQLLSDIIEDLLHFFSQSPDPDQALTYFERFVRSTYNKTNLFSYLKESPYTLWLIGKLMASSPFLSEILIRNATYLYWIADPETLDHDKPYSVLKKELSDSLQTLKSNEKKLETLARFKRKELLRIGVRDLLKKSSVQKTTEDLSDLARLILQTVFTMSEENLRHQYPRAETGYAQNGPKKTLPFTVLGMGKLGGSELNFSSDIDLIYIYDTPKNFSPVEKSHEEKEIPSPAEYFQRLSQEVTSALTGLTNEGFLYRVDLRLRPEGQSGTIAVSLKSCLQYYKKRGQTWERLALLKAWPVAGDLALGKNLLWRVSPFIYQSPFSVHHLEEVKGLKDKIDRNMKMRGETDYNLKLGKGGIREIEFIVQALQAFFGRKNPKIKERNTLNALWKLTKEKFIPQGQYRQLKEAYLFLRNVEHRLQMVHERQTHLIPRDPEGLRGCALRLDYRDRKNEKAEDRFLKDYRSHTHKVHRMFTDLFTPPHSSPILRSALKRAGQPFPKRSSKN